MWYLVGIGVVSVYLGGVVEYLGDVGAVFRWYLCTWVVFAYFWGIFLFGWYLCI